MNWWLIKMKYAILITGDLAGGKSSLAVKLSKMMDIPYFFKDKTKEVLAERIGFSNREENKNLSFASFDILYMIAEQFTLLDKSIILENNFRQNELNLLEKLFTERGYSLFTIVLEGNLDILYKRYVNRKENENRHPAHYFFATMNEYKNYVEESRIRDFPGMIIRINANDFEFLSDDSVGGLILKMNFLQRKSLAYKPFLIGGSICGKKLENNMLIKFCHINYDGVENGYQKLRHEAEFIKKSNEKNEGLYPNVLFQKQFNEVYEVGYEFLYDGITFADIIQNDCFSMDYLNNSLEYIINELTDKLYLKTLDKTPDKNYINRFYFDRVKRRLNLTIDICEENNMSTKLKNIILDGVIINGNFYPSIYKYLEILEKDLNLNSKLAIKNSTKSHHDLIPGNILVQIAKNSISSIKLIDPRGDYETGENNRNAMYDLGKLLFGIGGYDILRFFNGKVNSKAYIFEELPQSSNIHSFIYYFDKENAIVQRCTSLRKNFLSFLKKIDYSHLIKEEYILEKILFSEFTMYLSDIPCRVIDEKDEEMCICFLLEGILLLSDYFKLIYKNDFLRKNEKDI